MSINLKRSLGWGLAGVLGLIASASLVRADDSPAAAPPADPTPAASSPQPAAPAAPEPAPADLHAAPASKGPVARALAEAAPPPAETASPAPAPDASASGSDRSIRLSGSGELLGWVAVAGSMRQGIFNRSTSNSDFLLTHVHPKLTANLGPKALTYIEFCITHPRVGPQPEQAYFEYDLGERLNFQAGRFLVPFGQWNQIHDVFDHKSIAYPLMYLGHEEEELALRGGPTPIVSTAFTDIGVLGYGSFWPSSSDQIWYGAYVCNGRFGGTDLEWEDLWNTYRDNNSDKAYGGRAVWTHGDNLSIGGSYQTGHYDPQNHLRYQFAGADLYYRIAKKINLRAEYLRNPVDSMVRGYTKTGWYVSADMPVGKKHEVVAMYSHLRQYPADTLQNMGRASIGFNTYLTRTLKLKTEVDHIILGHFTGDPTNATATQFGTSFQDTTRFRASLVAIF